MYLTEGIGNGTVTLDNVTVDGKTLVCGGGMESIIIKNTTLGEAVVQKKNGKVRLEASGSSKVGKVQMNSDGKLEEKDLSDVGFEDVEVKKDKSDDRVQFDGDFKNVDIMSGSKIEVTKGSIAKLQTSEDAQDAEINVLAGSIASVEIKSKVTLDILDGSISQIMVDQKSTGSKINVSENAFVAKLVTEAVIEVSGKGKVELAELKVSGVKFETKPVKIEASDGILVQIGLDSKPAPVSSPSATPTPTPKATSGSSGGGGSSGGSSTPTPKSNVTLELISSSHDSVFVSVYNDDAGQYIEGLGSNNFTLKKGQDTIALTVQEAVYEYQIIPEELLEIGTYKLTFTKTGYKSANIEFEIENHIVIFYFNSGEDDEVVAVLYAEDEGTLEEIPDDLGREGYTFIGWSTDPEATEADFDTETIINQNTLVYAVWIRW